MTTKIHEVICCTLLVLSVVGICYARPPQSFNDPSSQVIGGGGPSNDLDSAAAAAAARNLIETGDDLQALKMQLLAQQLAEYNAVPQLAGFGGGVGPDRFVLSKRQQRFRQCYFNPISCFRK